MKKQLMIRKATIWGVGILIIVAMVAGCYFANPYYVPDEVNQQIIIEEGLD